MSATRWKGFKPLNRILLLFLLSVSSLYAEVFVRDDIIRDPDPRSFSVCYNHTCKDLETVGLNTEQWQGIRMSFNPPAEDAGKERRQIAVAIARMERLVGQLVNTEQDRGGNMAGLLSGKRQMDCIDESTNTTNYLAMMQKDRLLKWHRLEDRSTRGFFIFGMPHTTAVINDRSTGLMWAVDSWFHDNGVPPEILPLDQWRGGWEPESVIRSTVTDR